MYDVRRYETYPNISWKPFICFCNDANRQTNRVESICQYDMIYIYIYGCIIIMCFVGQIPTSFVSFSFDGLPVNACWALMPLPQQYNPWKHGPLNMLYGCGFKSVFWLSSIAVFPETSLEFCMIRKWFDLKTTIARIGFNIRICNQRSQRSFDFECLYFSRNPSNHYAKVSDLQN